MSQYTSSSLSTSYTTLTQDAFRLYHGVIDHVIDNVKQELIECGKSQQQADEIAAKLEKKWKENLEKSGCIDNRTMLGVNTNESYGDKNDIKMKSDNNEKIDNGGSNSIPISFTADHFGGGGFAPAPYSHNNNNNNNSNINDNNSNVKEMMAAPMNRPMSGSMGHAAGMQMGHMGQMGQMGMGMGMGSRMAANPYYSGVHSQGPARKRARFESNRNNNNNNNNHNNNNRNEDLQGPSVIAPTFPNANPHIKGMGVPRVDQVPNPFENVSGNSRRFGQRDGANDDCIDDCIDDCKQNDNILSQTIDENGVTTVKLKKSVKMSFVQVDGPMLPSSGVKGFSDDEDDVVKSRPRRKLRPTSDETSNDNKNENEQSIKNENDNDNDNDNGNDSDMDNDKEKSKSKSKSNDNDNNKNPKLMFNGRDLNGPLNSEDDDSCEEQDLQISDIIRCQFTKINRSKQVWKIELKNGIMHIDNKDFAFLKATNGSFDWKS